MKKLLQFFKDSYVEMTQHVTWLSYRELQNNAVLVLVASLIFALLIGVMDLGIRNVVDLIYNSF
ncbi:MAG: preprotein translocase subunit SecE [Flammeovirgaceae bacterium]|nr:preprotein translocase subunit SecE [Flammeovirgaceae bacterium]MDW8287311.1 preprotein translocase subunit SecE [Flammeovirgaceae bacterium]